MRICFISHSSFKGGAERSLLDTIDVLRKRGIECIVALPGKGPLINELTKRNIPYFILPFKWWMSVKGSSLLVRVIKIILNLFVLFPLSIKIIQHKCDIIYTNTITIPIGVLVSKLTRRYHIWHIREFGYEDHNLVFDIGTKFSIWLMRRLPSVYIANSNAVAQKYKKYMPDCNIKVVYQMVRIINEKNYLSMVEKGKACKENDYDIKCAIIGSLQKGKGQEDAIRAVNKVIRENIKIKLYIVGQGDIKYKEYLYNLVDEYGLKNQVTFLGYIDNAFMIMKNCDLVLVCSRCEAFGRVTVEAMLVGKPVIGTRSGGTIELIKEGFNGLLYTPGDYEELAEKIIYLHKHPDIAKQMGRNGKKWATTQFNEERYGDNILAILRELK